MSSRPVSTPAASTDPLHALALRVVDERFAALAQFPVDFPRSEAPAGAHAWDQLIDRCLEAEYPDQAADVRRQLEALADGDANADLCRAVGQMSDAQTRAAYLVGVELGRRLAGAR